MNINVAQRDLQDRLAFLAKGISRTRPAVLVEAHADGRVELTADHGDLFARAAIEAAVVEPGRCLLPAASAPDIVATLPKDTLALRYTEAKGKIELRCGRIRSSLTPPALAAMPPGLAEDFPEIGWPSDEPPHTVLSEALHKLIAAAGYATAHDDQRVELTGAQLKLDGNAIGLVTTDSLRLAVAQVTCPGLKATRSASIVPGSFIRDLESILGEDKHVSLWVTGQRVIARCGGLTLLALPLSGTYPEYGAIVPRPTQQTPALVCDRVTLTDALRAVAVIARENAQTLAVRWAEGEVQLAAKAAETGHANGGFKGQTVGEIDALVNARFFADAVAATHGERVRISILDPGRPIRVEPEPAPKDWQQVAVIMPILPK